MNRREFFALGPAFPVAAASATLTLREDGKDPIDLSVNVLKVEPGDVLVLQASGLISTEIAGRIRAHVESEFPGVRVMVLDRDLKLEGVVRGLPK